MSGIELGPRGIIKAVLYDTGILHRSLFNVMAKRGESISLRPGGEAWT